jgi:single-strand DNA-binding protein
MANVNKVILIGNLTRDPQLTYTPNTNTPVAEFGMAVNHRWRSGSGEQKEEVCFIDLRAFGKQAEVLNQYMKKGRQLYVEGRLTYETWQAQDGSKRSRHRIIVENFQFLGDRRDGEGGGDAGGGGRPWQGRSGSAGARPAGAPAPSAPSDPLDDAPPPPAPDDGPGPGPGPEGDKIPF